MWSSCYRCKRIRAWIERNKAATMKRKKAARTWLDSVSNFVTTALPLYRERSKSAPNLRATMADPTDSGSRNIWNTHTHMYTIGIEKRQSALQDGTHKDPSGGCRCKSMILNGQNASDEDCSFLFGDQISRNENSSLHITTTNGDNDVWEESNDDNSNIDECKMTRVFKSLRVPSKT